MWFVLFLKLGVEVGHYRKMLFKNVLKQTWVSAAVPGALKWPPQELQTGRAGSRTRDSAPGRRLWRLCWGWWGPRGSQEVAPCVPGRALATPRALPSSLCAEAAPKACPLSSPWCELPRHSRDTMAHLRATMVAPEPPPTMFPPPPLPRDPFTQCADHGAAPTRPGTCDPCNGPVRQITRELYVSHD